MLCTIVYWCVGYAFYFQRALRNRTLVFEMHIFASIDWTKQWVRTYHWYLMEESYVPIKYKKVIISASTAASGMMSSDLLILALAINTLVKLEITSSVLLFQKVSLWSCCWSLIVWVYWGEDMCISPLLNTSRYLNWCICSDALCTNLLPAVFLCSNCNLQCIMLILRVEKTKLCAASKEHLCCSSNYIWRVFDNMLQFLLRLALHM